MECSHTNLSDGPQIPRRHGSYKSQICTCSMWRTLEHGDNPIINEWRNDSIDVASREDYNLYFCKNIKLNTLT